jgi:hypothetical protein
MQLLRECWSFLTKLMTCQNLQNKLLNITVLFIWYLLASLKKMSLAKHGELFFILASNSFSPLAILASVWKIMVSHTVNVVFFLNDLLNVVKSIDADRYKFYLCIIKSPKQRLETYCFCTVSYYYSPPPFLSFRGIWTCPRQISGTTGQNFMKLGGVIDICF